MASCSPRSASCSISTPTRKTLTTRDMFVPTCATCHMSGINGLKVTHDPSERLGWYLADAVTTSAPTTCSAQADMKQVCTQCHTQALIDRVYSPGRKSGGQAPTPRFWPPKTSWTAFARMACSPDRRSRIPSTSPTSISGITTAAPPSTAPSWAAPISSSGTAITNCSQKTVELQHDADELRREHAHK